MSGNNDNQSSETGTTTVIPEVHTGLHSQVNMTFNVGDLAAVASNDERMRIAKESAELSRERTRLTKEIDALERTISSEKDRLATSALNALPLFGETKSLMARLLGEEPQVAIRFDLGVMRRGSKERDESYEAIAGLEPDTVAGRVQGSVGGVSHSFPASILRRDLDTLLTAMKTREELLAKRLIVVDGLAALKVQETNLGRYQESVRATLTKHALANAKGGDQLLAALASTPQTLLLGSQG